MRPDRLYLLDIEEAALAIGRFLEGIDEGAFLSDELIQSAVLQKLTVIGEAAARVSTEVKLQPPAQGDDREALAVDGEVLVLTARHEQHVTRGHEEAGHADRTE